MDKSNQKRWLPQTSRRRRASTVVVFALILLGGCGIDFDKKSKIRDDLLADASSAEDMGDAAVEETGCGDDGDARCCGRDASGCDTNEDFCAGDPCKNGGLCANGSDGFSCNCPAAWTGDTCEIDVDECTESVPAVCPNGTCLNTKGGFLCTCPASGYELNAAGTDCVDIDECSDASRCGQTSGFGTCENGLGHSRCVCNQGHAGANCELIAHCEAPNVCTEDYPCVEEGMHESYRCAGQFPEWALNAAPQRFLATADVVSDAMTGLIWQLRVDATLYNWNDAKTHCTGLGEGFRLPTITELLSIVDLTTQFPAIDALAFPETPLEPFWSSSRYVGHADTAWTVYFSTGSSGAEATSDLRRVRCVR